MRRLDFVGTAFLIALMASAAMSQSSKMNSVAVTHIKAEVPITSLDDPAWQNGKEVAIDTYWSGKEAPNGRHFKARLLWSDTALYVRFEANQEESLIVSDQPDLAKKTLGLWDRDVCEIFVAPDAAKPDKYFEFEVAPTGEWVDVGIEFHNGKRISDFEYSSGMTSAVRIDTGKVTSAIKIPWKALGKTPKHGDRWRGNLFRCVGKDPTRGYLAWQPTLTGEPSFHVPSKFGVFQF